MTDTARTGRTDADTISFTLDGHAVEARPGELVIAAAERNGVYIPRFCWHPRMREVGMCRMCLVDVDTGRGPTLQPACMVPASADMAVDTRSERVKKAQDGVLEFLLVNHPLDCPVCDKGGECPLQDQTLTYGPGETRFVEEKRHWPKPIPISDLVHLDRERCVLCDRCTRFADEVAGDPLITFVGRGGETQVNTFPDDPFRSYFSGNTVQICPVGALLARPYRFRARPWDLDQVESTCTTCAVGCRTAVQSSQNRLLRYLGIDVDPVNWGWLCDKGRFDFEWVNSDDRLGEPVVRQGDDLVPSRWADALTAASDGLRQARDRHGASSIAVVGGSRLTNEDAYAWAKLAKSVLGTDNVDAQLGDGLPAEVVVGVPRATIDEACDADTLVLIGPDIKEELPVLYLRVRDAVMRRGLKLVELSPHDTGLTRYAEVSIRYRPGELADLVQTLLSGSAVNPADTVRASELVRDGTVVCALGRPSLAEPAGAVVEAAGLLARARPEVRFLSTLRRANVHGALDMGLAPGLLPGRVSLDDGRAWFEEAWGPVPAASGLDTHGILTAAADGRVRALVLLGADPLSDFPDRDLARRALTGAGFVVAVDCFLTESARQADVVLPAAGYAEKAGTTTNIEGRISVLNAKITPPGTARADWMIASELAVRLGADLGFESTVSIWDEIAHLAPSHRGVTPELLHSVAALDGVVVPLGPDGLTRPVSGGVSQADEPAVMAAGLQAGADRKVVEGPGGDLAVARAVQPGVTVQSEEDPPAGDHESTVEEGTEESGPPVAPAAGGTSGSAPPPLRFRPAAERRPSPPVDSYAVRLVSGRKLYDCGTLTRQSPSLAGLATPADLRLSPVEADRLGVRSGERVRVWSARGSLTLDVVVDAGVARGTAVLPFNAPGQGAADLIDAAAPVTELRIETLGSER